MNLSTETSRYLVFKRMDSLGKKADLLLRADPQSATPARIES